MSFGTFLAIIVVCTVVADAYNQRQKEITKRIAAQIELEKVKQENLLLETKKIKEEISLLTKQE